LRHFDYGTCDFFNCFDSTCLSISCLCLWSMCISYFDYYHMPFSITHKKIQHIKMLYSLFSHALSPINVVILTYTFIVFYYFLRFHMLILSQTHTFQHVFYSYFLFSHAYSEVSTKFSAYILSQILIFTCLFWTKHKIFNMSFILISYFHMLILN